MEDKIRKIEVLQNLLRTEMSLDGTLKNMYGLLPEDEKEIREKLVSLIKQI